MKSLEKIFFVLNELKDLNELKLKDEKILFHFAEPIHNEISDNDIFKIMKKLEKDEKAIKIIEMPKHTIKKEIFTYEDEYYLALQYLGKDPYSAFVLELTNRFDLYYDEIKRKIEGIEIPENEKGKIAYFIKYNSIREIILNNTYILAKPSLDLENDLAFKFLYDNPNKVITKQEVEDNIDKKLTKKISKIIENLGFRKDLRRMFFGNSTETQFYFKNPIYESDLKDLGIKKLNLD